MAIENKIKKIKVKFKNSYEIFLPDSDFNSCKEYYSNNKKCLGYKIFDFLKQFLKQLLNEYKNNYFLKLELKVEEKENKIIFSYLFFSPLNKELLHFKDFNFLSEGFKHFINEINDEKYRIKEKKISNEKIIKKNKETIEKEDNKNNSNLKVQSDANPNNTSSNSITLDRTIFSYELEYLMREKEKENDKYKIIKFMKHHKKRKQNEELIEILNLRSIYSKKEDAVKYIKLDLDSFSSSEDFEFSENSNDYINEKSIIFNRNDHEQAEKLNILFKKKFPSFPNEYKNCSIYLFIEYKEENILIFASQIGVFLYSQMDSGKTKTFLFPRTQNNAYKGLINIDKKGDLIALTSNEIIPEGENILLIYDISDKYSMKMKAKIPGYSFNIEANGLSMIYLDNKKEEGNEVEEEYLICACKKYYDWQKNGILLVDINNNFKDSFFDTEEFEVYCFYSITEKKEKINGYEIIGTGFFLAGGFDQTLGEGKIKLFMLIEDKNTKEKKNKIFARYCS